jgi:class 3 adenylate cyclase
VTILSADPPNDTLCERRQLTVLFCDLIGSTQISAGLDPEDESAILRRYHRHSAEEIANAGGFVAQFQGDGVIGFFGYQQARENDPERAVRAALKLIESLPRIATEQVHTLRVRIGIATGVVVAGDPVQGGTRLEQAAIGETINLAARLQSIAKANEIIIAGSTRRLIGGLFACRNLGPLQLKGFSEPIQAWQVVRERKTTTQFWTYREPILTQMLGRNIELDVLLGKWREAVAGDGRIVSIVGAAGMGKSRLVMEFRQRIAGEGHIWLEAGGSQFFQATPLYAASQLILRALDPFGRASPVELREKLKRALGDTNMESTDDFPLISEMLGLPLAPSCAPSKLTPSDRRNRLFGVLVDWLKARAHHGPVVLVIEDLHWVDPSSLELIELISKTLEKLPILVLLSMREEFRNPLHGTQDRIRLKPLSHRILAKIVTKVATAGNTLSGDVVGRVVKRADGIPLFAVELARLMMQRKASAWDQQIPSTLSDLLTARLDELGSAKKVAQVAAVIGNDASLSQLRIVSGIAKARLQTDLARLVTTGLLRRSGSTADPIFSFRHSLVRDAAYAALLKSRRHALHRRTAILFSEHFPNLVASRPEVLAHQWAQANEPRFAIDAWRDAGDTSGANRAYRESQQAYQAALSLLRSLPCSSERDALELTLQGSLAEVLRITCGYSAPQTIAATARARVLAEKEGDVTQQFVQAVGAWAAASSGGEYQSARHLADQVMRLARADGRTVSLAHAHMIQMTSRYRVGDLVGAEDYFRRGEDLFKSTAFRRHPGWAAQTYGNAARIAWSMGDEARAQQRIDLALSISLENDSPYDISFAQHMAAALAVLTGDLGSAVRFANESIRLADKHGFPQFSAISRIALGRAKAGCGAPAEGLRLIRRGLARMAVGSRVAITLYMTWLAETQNLGGHLKDALCSVEKALKINRQELYFRPASLLLRGSLNAQRGSRAKAEQDFTKAMRLSLHMGATLFYNRAAESLHRLLTEPERNDA